MSVPFGVSDVESGGLRELLFYDQCFTKRWYFWLTYKTEIKYLFYSLINGETNLNTNNQDSFEYQKLKKFQKEIPRIKFLDKPNKEVIQMLYTCLDIIDDLSEVKYEQELEDREYQRFFILCEFISLYLGLTENSQTKKILDQDLLIELSENFLINGFLRYPYDYLGEIYENLNLSFRKNVNLRPINTTSDYGLIFSQSLVEFPLMIDQNVETGRRLLSLSNDYFFVLGYSSSIIETIITQINLHIYSPWLLSLKDLFNIDIEYLDNLIEEIDKSSNLEFSYRFPDEESFIYEDTKSYIDYKLINNYKVNRYLYCYYDSFPIFFKTKRQLEEENSHNCIPEIQYFPKLLALI